MWCKHPTKSKQNFLHIYFETKFSRGKNSHHVLPLFTARPELTVMPLYYIRFCNGCLHKKKREKKRISGSSQKSNPSANYRRFFFIVGKRPAPSVKLGDSPLCLRTASQCNGSHSRTRLTAVTRTTRKWGWQVASKVMWLGSLTYRCRGTSWRRATLGTSSPVFYSILFFFFLAVLSVTSPFRLAAFQHPGTMCSESSSLLWGEALNLECLSLSLETLYWWMTHSSLFSATSE